MKFLFASLAIALCWSCQSKPSSPQVAAVPKLPIKRINLYLRYLDGKRELQGEARFLSDTAQFALPHGVLLNGEVLTAKKLPNVGWDHRLVKSPTLFKPPYIFTYKETDGKEISLPIATNTRTNMRLGSPAISKSKGGVLTWDGEALKSDESLTIVLVDSEGYSMEFNHTGVTNGNQYDFPHPEMGQFKIGKATMSVIYKAHFSDLNSKPQLTKTFEHYYTEQSIQIAQ